MSNFGQIEKESFCAALAVDWKEHILASPGEEWKAWALAANEAIRDLDRKPWFSTDRAVSSAVLRIGNDIGTSGATAETLLSAIEGVTSIDLQINSRGGCGNTSLALYRGFKGRVNTCTINKFCASGAVIIAMAAKKIRIEAGARVMLHRPKAFAFTDAAGLYEAACQLADACESMKAILSERTGQPDAVIDSWFNTGDFYFTAQEAVDVRLADEIYTAPELSPMDPRYYDRQTDESEIWRFLKTFPAVRVKDRAKFLRSMSAWMTHNTMEL